MPSFLGMDLRGHLDLLLLGTLRQTGPAHGYALIAALRERGYQVRELILPEPGQTRQQVRPKFIAADVLLFTSRKGFSCSSIASRA